MKKAIAKRTTNRSNANQIGQPSAPSSAGSSRTIRAQRVTRQPQPPSDRTSSAGVSDAAVHSRTGRTWRQWCTVLDQHGAQQLPHKEIAKLLHEKYGLTAWWAQSVTVGYEQARGLREKYQRCGGDFQASKSRTYDVPVTRLFDALTKPAHRRHWLDDPGCTITTSTRPKSVRIAWVDGRTRVDVNLYARGNGRGAIQLQHEKLADAAEVAAKKKYWERQFTQLRDWLAGSV